MKYAFIRECAHEHSIALMRTVLEVSRRGFYRFRRHLVGAQENANVILLEEIKNVHAQSQGTYGSPRVHRQLLRQGHACGRHRVARLMAKEGIVGNIRRGYRVATRQRKGALEAPDLVKRAFLAVRPHQLWTSDMTYIWTAEGWLYLAVILDAFSRTIVGWATSKRINAQLVCTAFQRAICQYRPGLQVIFHRDLGSQYTSKMFRALPEAQPVPFIQSNGYSCFDNAVTETLFHMLKTESLDDEDFQPRLQAHHHLFNYIEVFYNQNRLHSSLGYHTPREALRGPNNTTAA